MRVILHRGGNYKADRFEASAQPQDVPEKFGQAMIARGYAEKVAAPKKQAAPAVEEVEED